MYRSDVSRLVASQIGFDCSGEPFNPPEPPITAEGRTAYVQDSLAWWAAQTVFMHSEQTGQKLPVIASRIGVSERDMGGIVTGTFNWSLIGLGRLAGAVDLNIAFDAKPFNGVAQQPSYELAIL